MPVVYRVKGRSIGESGQSAVFAAKKGDANRIKREFNKENRDDKTIDPAEVETLKLSGRDELVALLNDPSGDGSPATEEDDPHGLL